MQCVKLCGSGGIPPRSKGGPGTYLEGVRPEYGGEVDGEDGVEDAPDGQAPPQRRKHDDDEDDEPDRDADVHVDAPPQILHFFLRGRKGGEAWAWAWALHPRLDSEGSFVLPS